MMALESVKDSCNISVSLPDDCMPLEHQVAGHFYGKEKLGLLQTNDGHVLKVVQAPPRGDREHSFFKRLFCSELSQLSKDEIDLRRIVPTYCGSLVHGDILFIKMENLAHGIKHPSVIDFKMGRITYDPEATSEKIERQRAKYPPCETTGFQLIGMRVFCDETTKSFCRYDKKFGRSLSQQDLIHAIAIYYQFHQMPQKQAIRRTLQKLEDVLSWFQTQTTFRFFSASLLFVYESQLERLFHDSVNNNNVPNDDYAAINADPVRVKLADFAHVFPTETGRELDENNLFGVRNLMEHLRRLLDENYEFKDIRKF